MAASTYGTATAFVLQELPADAPGAREIKLAGRALPYRPMAVGGTMRASVNWYPGNPVATVQILGPEEDAITVHGMWKDRFIGTVDDAGDDSQADIGEKSAIALINGVQVEDAFTLAQTIDQMRREGRYVRLSWDLLIREGFIERFVATFERHEDVEWELVFRVTSQGDTFAPAVISSETDLAGSVSAWSKIKNALAKAASDNPFQFAADYLDDLTETLTDLGAQIDGVVDSISATSDSFLSVPSNARRLAGVAQGIIDTAKRLVDLASQQPPTTAFTLGGEDSEDSGDESGGQPSFGDYIAAQTWLQQFNDIGRAAGALGANERQKFTAQVQPDLIGQFVAREGLDLRVVSQRFYGTPDQWPLLMRYNDFDSSGLEPGDLVLVPRLGAVSSDPVGT